MKYTILQDYIKQFDAICLTETKCDLISDNEINGFKSFIMPKKNKKHKHGGIHGICVFIREHIAHNCTIIDKFVSESVLWIHLNKNVSGFEFILGAVYLPHEASDYHHEDIYEFLADDIITIKATLDVPIILLGDFNSRVGLKTDFEYESELEGLYLEQDPLLFFFDKHDLLERINKDGYTNNNGNKLIELCKMSDLKIANGRMGKDRGIGNYTCHTTNGKSTIDFAILSMELFPYVDDFYVDILDKCMSDVHCPICLVMICKPTVSIKNDNCMHTDSKYEMDKRITCKWKPELDNQYLSSFNMRNIQKFQQQLAAIISYMSHATQKLIDHLYTNMKSIFIEPASSTGIYREHTNNSRNVRNQSRQHGKKVWFNRECELLRKKCMTIKNSLKHVCNPQYQLFHEHVKQYKNVVSKTKKIYTRKFHSDIRKLKTKNPKEFWKVIKT